MLEKEKVIPIAIGSIWFLVVNFIIGILIGFSCRADSYKTPALRQASKVVCYFMKHPLINLLITLTVHSCYGQESIKVSRQYDSHKPKSSNDSFFQSIPNTIFISLDEGFNDSLYITVNDTVFLNQYLKSNESIGYAGGFVISFNKPTDSKILKLKFVNSNFYIEEKVNLAYKFLQIRGLKPWLLLYTNQFVTRE